MDSHFAAKAGPAEMLSHTPVSLQKAWLLVALITLLSILSLLDRNIVSLFMDDIRNYLKISDVQASLIYGGAFAITFSLMGLPIGWAVDRMSRRGVIFSGVSLWSVATVACGLASSFPMMLAARALVGAGEAALVPSAQSIISDMFPPERRTLPFAFYGMGQKAGAGIALIIGGWLAALLVPHATYALLPGFTFHGWQLILFLIGLPGVAIAGLIFAFPEPQRRHVGFASAGYGSYLRYMVANWRYFVGHHLGFVAAQSLITAIMSWTPSFFQRSHGWTVSEVGLWFGSMILLGPLVGLPIHGWVCDRMFTHRLPR